MPYKDKLCGIYVISTPNGSKYVGSSHNIYRRWSEHRGHLRRGTHHSDRLQKAWDKHGGRLAFEVHELCSSSDLESREQAAIDQLKAELNTTNYVGNVWANPETREKLRVHHTSKEWKDARSKIAKTLAARRGVAVDCSDGRSFINLHEAGKAFGVSAGGIRALIQTQRIGRLGVRFKRADEPWRDVITSAQQRLATMVANDTLKRSEESRKKMSISAQNKTKAPRNSLGQWAKSKGKK